MKRYRQWKIQRAVLERRTFCFSSYKNHKLKIKLWWDGACKRSKRVFSVWFILFERNLFNICVLSQYIVYWMHFQNIHTLLENIQNITSYTLYLFIKLSKAFSVSLNKKKENRPFALNLSDKTWNSCKFVSYQLFLAWSLLLQITS